MIFYLPYSTTKSKIMKSILSLFVFATLLASCNSKKKTTEPEIKKDSVVIQPAPTANQQPVTYVSATVYTGRSDFFFKDENGETITVGISNFPEDKGAIYPKSLLESSDTIEGPPSENPAMVGKKFILVKNESGEVIEIKPAN